MSRDLDLVSPVVFSCRARYLLTTALISLALPVLLSTSAMAEDLFLNNGDEQPDRHTQTNGRWNQDSEIWSREDTFDRHRRLSAGDVAVLVARPNAPARDVTLSIDGQLAVSALRVDSSGYALVAGSSLQGEQPLLRGYRVGGTPQLDIIFNGAGGALDPVLDLGVALGGNVTVNSAGQINYSGQSRRQQGNNSVNGLWSLDIGQDADFVTTGTTAGQLNVGGTYNMRGDAVHDGDTEIRSGGSVLGEGVLRGSVTNDGTLRAGVGAQGGSNTLEVTGTVTNRSGGVLGADARATLDVGRIVNEGTVNATGGTITVAPSTNDDSRRLTNNGNGTLNVSGGGTFNGNVTNNNSGSVVVGASGTVNGTLENRDQGTIRVERDGVVSGDVSNRTVDGTVTIAEGGRLNGAVTGNDGNVVIGGRVTGRVTNNVPSSGNVTPPHVTVEETGRIGALRNRGGTTEVHGTIDNWIGVGIGSSVILAEESTVGGVVRNYGTLTAAGEIRGDVENYNTATLGNTTAGDPAVVGGDYTNHEGAETTLVGTSRVGGDFTNNGTLRGQETTDTTLAVTGTFTSTGSIIGSATDASTITITAGLVVFGKDHVLSGNVEVNGAVANGGTMNHDADTLYTMGGDLMNTPGGTVNVVTELAGDNRNIINYSDYNVAAGGVASGIGIFSNLSGGVLDIAVDPATGTGGSLSAATIVNGQGGTITNAGTLSGTTITNNAGGSLRNTGTMAGAVDSRGTLVSTGTINGTLLLQGRSDTTLSGGVTGAVNVQTGEMRTGGDLTVGSLRNSGTTTVTSGHVMTVQDGPVGNNGGTLNVDGTVSGDVTNVNSGTITLGNGTITGIVRNWGGTLEGTGTINGAVGNGAQGDIIVAGGTLTVGGTTTNQGDIRVGGTYDGTISNIEQGTVTLDGGRLAGVLTNEALLQGSGALSERLANGENGTVLVGQGNTLTMEQGTDNQGTITLAGGRIGGAIDNTGDITGSGRLLDRVDNRADGDIIVNRNDDMALTGGLTNEGTVTVAGDISGAISNVGTGVIALAGGEVATRVDNDATINGTGTLAGGVDNGVGGLVDVRQGDQLTLGGTLDSTGTVNVAGLLTGAVDINGGTLAFQGGELRGNVTNLGSISGTGRIDGRLANNAATGTVTIGTGEQLTVTDVTTNAGTVTVNTGGQLDTALRNTSGTLNLAGVLNGRLDNSGVAELAGGVVTGVVVNENIMTGTGELRQGLVNNGTATLAGLILGETRNNDQLNVEGTLVVEDLVTNAGGTTLVRRDSRLESAGTIDNAQGGTMTVNGTVAFAGERAPDPDSVLISNEGTLDGNGRVEGVVYNREGGDFRMGGYVTSLWNEGDVLLTQDQSLIAARGITNESDLVNRGTISGNISNAGDLTSGGTVTGAILNTGTATLGGSVSGLVDNRLTLNTGGDLTVGGIENVRDATVTINEGHNLTAAEVIGNAGTFSVAGRLTGDLVNRDRGTLHLDRGVIAGDVLSRGAVTGTGRITGTFDNQADLTLSSSLRVGTLDNSRRLTIERGTTLTADDALVNRATLNLLGRLNGALETTADGTTNLGNGVTVTGAARNAGTMELGVATIGGVLNNTGTVDMRSGATNGLLTTGGLSGNGTYLLDIDLDAMTSDRIRVTGGPVTGNLFFTFDSLGTTTVNRVGERVTVAEFDPAQGSNFTYGYDPIEVSSPRIVYDLVRNPDNGNLEMVSGTNPAIGALLGNVALTHSLIGSVINRPNSPYVVGMAYDDPEKPCGIGTWARALGGTATANGNTNNGNADYNSEVKADYYGMQVGTDLACFDGGLAGWSTAFGALLGVNQGSTEQPNYLNSNTNSANRVLGSMTTSDFDQIYGGVYMTATKGNWAVDLQYRHEVTDFEIDNRAVAGDALGITDASFSSRANTISGAVSYMMPIAETGWQFIPSVGFAWSKFSIDDINFNDGYKLEFDDGERQVGFFGGTVTKTYIQPSTDSALNVFATGTYYKDFADATRSTFTMADDPDFAPQYLTSDNLGSYTELSIGANYIKVLSGQFGKARQLSAGTRIDARFGDQLDSVGVTGQIRLQF